LKIVFQETASQFLLPPLLPGCTRPVESDGVTQFVGGKTHPPEFMRKAVGDRVLCQARTAPDNNHRNTRHDGFQQRTRIISYHDVGLLHTPAKTAPHEGKLRRPRRSKVLTYFFFRPRRVLLHLKTDVLRQATTQHRCREMKYVIAVV